MGSDGKAGIPFSISYYSYLAQNNIKLETCLLLPRIGLIYSISMGFIKIFWPGHFSKNHLISCPALLMCTCNILSPGMLGNLKIVPCDEDTLVIQSNIFLNHAINHSLRSKEKH